MNISYPVQQVTLSPWERGRGEGLVRQEFLFSSRRAGIATRKKNLGLIRPKPSP